MRFLGAIFVVLASVATSAGGSAAPRTELVSVAWNGSWIEGSTSYGALSGGGRYAIFASPAQNVVRSHRSGIFLRDRRKRTTTLLLPRSGAILRMTPDARVIVFCTSEPLSPRDGAVTSADAARYADVYVYDRRSRKIMWASTRFRNGRSPTPEPACDGRGEHDALGTPGISADGRLVVFSSEASNIVRHDTNKMWDVFVRDLVTRRTRRVSLTSSGKQLHGASTYPVISADGRYVFFCSGETKLVGRSLGIVVRDLQRRTTRLVTTRRDGRPLAPLVHCGQSVSANGRFLAFETTSPDVVQPPPDRAQLVVKDLRAGTYDVIPRGIDENGAGATPFWFELSANGRYLAFSSLAVNLVPGDDGSELDVFWHDRARHDVRRVSVRADGRQSEREAMGLALSADGRWVLWNSRDPDIIPGEPHRWPRDETYDDFIYGPLH